MFHFIWSNTDSDAKKGVQFCDTMKIFKILFDI